LDGAEVVLFFVRADCDKVNSRIAVVPPWVAVRFNSVFVFVFGHARGRLSQIKIKTHSKEPSPNKTTIQGRIAMRPNTSELLVIGENLNQEKF